MLRFCLFFLCMPAIAAPALVTLHDESIVTGAFIRLGDIAATEALELRELRIGHSPRAGAALVLKRNDVQRALGRLKPAPPVRVEGAQRVTVRRGPLEKLELRVVRQSAEQALRQALAGRYARFEVEPVSESLTPIAIPVGQLELRPRPPLQITAGRVTVWTDVLVDGRHYQSVPAWFSVRAWQPALVARRALRPGEPLGGADFELREAEVVGIAPAAADLDLAALRLRQPLAAGAILARQHVDQALSVARHQPVLVRVALGAVALETTAVASRDARPGEVIRVRNVETNQTYPARVAGPGVVEALWR
jgi:flagella basal body P-ring formation protein FlgA